MGDDQTQQSVSTSQRFIHSATLDLSIVYVHYKTPQLLLESISCCSRQFKQTQIRFEIIIIDNSADLDPEDFNGKEITIITPESNLGYAGGINWAVWRSRANKIIVLNPDVMPINDCLQKLLLALKQFDICGPQLFLDRKLTFRLPPIESNAFIDVLLKRLAKKIPSLHSLAYQRWQKHAQRYWQSDTDVAGYDLSGAMLAFNRELFYSVGEWDDQFFLFFEEADWLRRIKNKKLKSAYIPSAKAVHLYSQSICQAKGIEQIYLKSETRFLKKYLNSYQRRILRCLTQVNSSVTSDGNTLTYTVPTQPMILELAYSETGFPATRAFINNPEEFSQGLPLELQKQLHADKYYLRWIDKKGRVFSQGCFGVKK